MFNLINIAGIIIIVSAIAFITGVVVVLTIAHFDILTDIKDIAESMMIL